MVTLVYAKCDRIERIELWDSLYSLASDITIPWLVGGYFNVITDEHEKYGGSVYTWGNGRGAEDCIFKRLDRCLGNFEFQQLFPGLEITHLIKTGSDHSPLLGSNYGDIFQQITNLEEVAKAYEVQFESNSFLANREKMQKVNAELIRIYVLKEEFWKQKAGMTWFEDGDKNSKFFHAYLNGRRKRLQLKRIQNSQGQWLEEKEHMAEEAVRFFQAQF
ncbi:uncharacterized protein LOC132611727 [Lycium barbarum]|uniref:uncharacterized protein LOC132611727 n=1 Tax=Lycium barbarum TaxID=112863 RepID=UPI00293E539E|nr:uncharacterized protein LOC132611727 [Lycium barbarum]